MQHIYFLAFFGFLVFGFFAGLRLAGLRRRALPPDTGVVAATVMTVYYKKKYNKILRRNFMSAERNNTRHRRKS